MISRWIAVLALQAAIGTGAALAGGHGDKEDKGDWEISLGAGAIVEPVSPGIDKHNVMVVPGVDIIYKNRVYLRTRDGLGFYAFNGDNSLDLTAGAVLKYDFGRDEDDAKEELQGLGDVDGSPELAIFAEKKFGAFAVAGELAKGLTSDGHNGWNGEVEASYSMPIIERTTFLSVGPFVSFGDENYLQSYYGVTSEQAARSRFTQNEQEAGFESVGLKAGLRHNFDPNWGLTGRVRYRQLIGDVADSPIVENQANFSGGLFLTYTFD